MTEFSTRQRFELFAQRASELESLRLAKQGIRAEYTIGWKKSDGLLRYDAKEPDEEDLRSYLLLFRKFISDDEPVFINRIFNDCERALSDESIKNELHGARAEWKKVLKNMGGIEVNINGENFSGERVLDLWINGHYFHDDADKISKLKQLTERTIPLVRVQLYSGLPGLSSIIFGVGHGIQKCLHEGKFSFDDDGPS